MNSCSVLIIDDSEIDRYLLKRQIEKLEIDVRVFESEDGSHAIDFLSDIDTNRRSYGDDFPPSYIFLDINMPILDGWGFLEAFAELRNKHQYQTFVIAMFTSSDRQEDRAKAKQYDYVANYLVKGDYTSEDLTKVLSSRKLAG